MEKKFRKAMKIAAATTIAATAYAAVNPAQSEAASTAENLVLKAESNKVPLIRAISVDYNADAVTQPWSLYNKAKKDYTAAKAAVNKLSGKEKERLNARLDTVKLWIDRTATYIDAITSGKKLIKAQEEMENYLAEGKMAEATKAYHALSYEIKKQAAYLYRVYGQSTRQAILETYKLPAEEAKQAALYPVSIYIEIGRLEAALQKEDFDSAEKYAANIEKWFNHVEDEDLLDVLTNYYSEVIEKYYPEIEEVALVEGVEFPTGSTEINGFQLFAFLDGDGNEWEIDPYEFGFSVRDDKGYFNEDGTLKDAYQKTGLTATGTVRIELIDDETKEVLLAATVNIVDGDQYKKISKGRLTTESGEDASYAVIGQKFQFDPTEAVTLNGKTVAEAVDKPLTLANFPGATFKSSDEKVFVVNASGQITPVSAGKANLTVTWNEEDYVLPIEVKSASAVQSFDLAQGKDKVYLNKNTSFDALVDAGYFTAKDQYGAEADLKNADVQLYSNKESVFTVSGENITLTGKEGDTASLIVKINGNVKSFPVVIDTTAPVLKGTTDKAVTNQNVTLTSDTADIASVAVKKDNTAILNYQLGTALTEQGVYEVTATDFAGNKQTITFEIDKTAPALTVSGDAASPVITASEALYYKNTAGELVAIQSANLDQTQANALFKYTGAGTLKSVTVNADNHTWTFATENIAANDTVEYKDQVLYDKAGNRLAESVKATFDGTKWNLVTQ
ncbi:cell surface protein [Bacillus methanolicus]|uniref:cell surface protein n=1 Tax=Bacillus methanolicus TaxID=1471 RepID=UPI002380A17F|nr:cell surface protein [Bacillus methanolicus]MDE3840265.1 cell surface protein [Bacillus methanolicus]